MNRKNRIRCLSIFVLMLLPAGAVIAQSGVGFRENCDAQLVGQEETARALVLQELDKAEAALGRGDPNQADNHIENAVMATMGVAGWSGSTSVKCMGEETYARYLDVRERTHRLHAELEPGNVARAVQNELWAAVRNPAKGKDSVMAVVPVEPRAYHDARMVFHDNVRRAEYDREIGAFVTDEEQALADLSAELTVEVVAAMNRHATRVLGEEKVAFNRPATPQELQAAEKLAGVGDLAQSMAGINIDPASQQKAMIVGRQVQESRELLRLARDWEFDPDGMSPDERTPSDLRAEQRGDTMLERGHDDSLSLQVRDEFYEMALDYYQWCNCRDKAAVAAKAIDAIQPALQAKEAADREKIEAMQAEMEKKTEGMQQAIDDMQKTEAEQQSFKDEADAMEAELGF